MFISAQDQDEVQEIDLDRGRETKRSFCNIAGVYATLLLECFYWGIIISLAWHDLHSRRCHCEKVIRRSRPGDFMERVTSLER